MEQTIVVRQPPNTEKFLAQLAALAKRYRVICMDAYIYATCRKFGRDKLVILPSEKDDLHEIPFWAFGYATGVMSVFYQVPDDARGVGDDAYELKASFDELRKNDLIDWALLVCRKGIPADTLRVATQLGEPWIDIPIDA